MNYRKLTPSMSLLLAFEASARHESFTRAAEELSLTQSAISRQVQTLEAMLGVSLFVREGKRITPTDVGRAYMAEVASALTLIRNATLQVLAPDALGQRLRVATLPTFGAKWLLPKLRQLYQMHPDLQIDLHSRIEEVDFATEPLDAAIAVWAPSAAHRGANRNGRTIRAERRGSCAPSATSSSPTSRPSGVRANRPCDAACLSS